MTDQIVFWILTGLFAILVALVGILFKQNLNANSKQAEAVNGLSENVAVLSERMQNFVSNCDKMEELNTRRLNQHSVDIGSLNKTTTAHDVTLGDHGRRINNLEQKQ